MTTPSVDPTVPDPKRPFKAYAAAAAAVVFAAGTSLTVALADGAMSAVDWVALGMAVVATPVFTGGAAYFVPNPTTLNRARLRP